MHGITPEVKQEFEQALAKGDYRKAEQIRQLVAQEVINAFWAGSAFIIFFLIFATFLLHFCIASYGGEEDEEYAEEQARDEIFHQEEPAEDDDYVPPTPRYGGSRPRANAPAANDAESIKDLRGKVNFNF